MDAPAFTKPGRFWRGNLHTHCTRGGSRLSRHRLHRLARQERASGP
jgi:hypothetical protein